MFFMVFITLILEGTGEAAVHLGPQGGGCPGHPRSDGELSSTFYIQDTTAFFVVQLFFFF